MLVVLVLLLGLLLYFVTAPMASAADPEGWVLQYEAGGFYDISAVDATTALAVGYYGTILKTTDGGDARPDIAYIAPSSGRIGVEVTISGCDFGSSRGSSSVSFGPWQAYEYPSWSDTQIKVLATSVPQVYQVTVTTPTGTSNGVSFTRTKPPCGTGGGMAVAMLGLTLGLLSVAGSRRIRKQLLMMLQ